MKFQASNDKERNFLELLDDNFNIIKPMYLKRESWLKHLDYSNSLYARATRTIVNYAPISKYWSRFFL